MARKRIAHLRDGIVRNISVAREDYVPRPGQMDVSGLTVGPGWSYNGSTWSPPTQDTPEDGIAPRALLRAFTLDEIDGIVGSTDATVRTVLERLRTYRELELTIPQDKALGLLTLFVSKGLLTAERRTEVIATLRGA
jgi:hypothetical protein